jgi:hypothetical protein
MWVKGVRMLIYYSGKFSVSLENFQNKTYKEYKEFWLSPRVIGSWERNIIRTLKEGSRPSSSRKLYWNIGSSMMSDAGLYNTDSRSVSLQYLASFQLQSKFIFSLLHNPTLTNGFFWGWLILRKNSDWSFENPFDQSWRPWMWMMIIGSSLLLQLPLWIGSSSEK